MEYGGLAVTLRFYFAFAIYCVGCRVIFAVECRRIMGGLTFTIYSVMFLSVGVYAFWPEHVRGYGYVKWLIDSVGAAKPSGWSAAGASAALPNIFEVAVTTVCCNSKDSPTWVHAGQNVVVLLLLVGVCAVVWLVVFANCTDGSDVIKKVTVFKG